MGLGAVATPHTPHTTHTTRCACGRACPGPEQAGGCRRHGSTGAAHSTTCFCNGSFLCVPTWRNLPPTVFRAAMWQPPRSSIAALHDGVMLGRHHTVLYARLGVPADRTLLLWWGRVTPCPRP